MAGLELKKEEFRNLHQDLQNASMVENEGGEKEGDEQDEATRKSIVQFKSEMSETNKTMLKLDKESRRLH